MTLQKKDFCLPSILMVEEDERPEATGPLTVLTLMLRKVERDGML